MRARISTWSDGTLDAAVDTDGGHQPLNLWVWLGSAPTHRRSPMQSARNLRALTRLLPLLTGGASQCRRGGGPGRCHRGHGERGGRLREGAAEDRSDLDGDPSVCNCARVSHEHPRE